MTPLSDVAKNDQRQAAIAAALELLLKEFPIVVISVSPDGNNTICTWRGGLLNAQGINQQTEKILATSSGPITRTPAP